MSMGDSEDASTRFGREVNRLRRLSGYTQARLAREVGGFSSSHISNVERGRAEPNLRLVKDLDRELHANGRLEWLWEQLTNTGEPVWLDELAGIEGQATSIMESQPAFVPALLQTEEYAHAVIEATSPWLTREEVEESAKERMRRAERFLTARTPAYRAVVDRTVFQRSWQNSSFHIAKQMHHILEQIERRRASLQIVDSKKGHPGLAGPFKVISSRTSPDVVYVESADSGQVSDDPERVQLFRLLFSDIQAMAYSLEESVKIIREDLKRAEDARA